MSNTDRLEQLDALRGIAALTVVASHFMNLQPLSWLRHTPVRLLAGGHEAVILFFVLSGFALTLQLTSVNSPTLLQYLVRRVFRIYLPYIVAVCLASVCYREFNAGPVPWAGDWFNTSWNGTLTNKAILGHTLLLFPFDAVQLDPVIWSLVYEMRISLIFPIVIFLLHQLPGFLFLSIVTAASLFTAAYEMHCGTNMIGPSLLAEWAPTAYYVLMFALGGVVAMQRQRIATAIRSTSFSWLLLLVSIFVYWFARPLAIYSLGRLGDVSADWLIMLASAGIIICAISNCRFSNALKARTLLFLGRISYSLYLIHLVILFTCVHGLSVHGPKVILLAAVLTVPISYLMYQLVERPSIRGGTLLARTLVFGRKTSEL